ncbi:unnamed protein product [Peniophora sp. CBMAI 1063]|nr:unnamed protein product [Peniophora sp. CBMAI 1063]
MSWFSKRSERNAIPPVNEEPAPSFRSAAPSYKSTPSIRSAASSYVPSRDGPSYQSNSGYEQSSYQRAPVTSAAPANDARANQDRSELFAGYNPQKAQPNRFNEGPSLGREPPPGEENDEDVEGIKKQTRWVKQESVNSTRNALRMAREAEETARGTLGRLGDQSEKLANTERHLDVAKTHSQRADDKTDELKQLNRSIFRPVITFNKDAKRAAKEAEIQRRYEEDRDQRERTMVEVRESQNRIGRAGGFDDEEGIGGRRGLTETQLKMRKDQRKRYQFEETASDDELEDELDDNLNEIGDVAKRLKNLGMAMGQELDQQNSRIDRLGDKAGGLDQRLFSTTERLKRIK